MVTQTGVDAITTGTIELDRRLGGGIPYNTVMLIEGQDAAGKSTFAQQFIWGTLNSGQKAVIYTTEQNVHSFLRQMESLGQDLTDYFLLNEIQVFPISTSGSSTDPNEVLDMLTKHIAAQIEPRMIVIDSLTTFVSRAGGDQIQNFFSELKRLCMRCLLYTSPSPRD